MRNQSCLVCKWFDYSTWRTCRAFPNGIPFEIASGDVFHNKITSEQKGNFIFEPIDYRPTKTEKPKIEKIKEVGMPIEYYVLRGISWKKKHPSGLFRIIRQEDSTTFERMDKEGRWVEDSSLIRHIAGYSDDAELITKTEVDEILKYYQGRK